MANRFSVLLVDDDPMILELLSRALNHKHNDVTAAPNGESAFEALGLNDFDLVITDLHMQRVDGFAVLKKAKALSPKTSVYVMTGDGHPDLTFRFLRLGADAFLPKPLDVMELLHRIGALYSRSELVRT